jgi:hypothetical protein
LPVARFVLRCAHGDAHARGVVVQRWYYMIPVVLGRVARPWTERRMGWQRKIVILWKHPWSLPLLRLRSDDVAVGGAGEPSGGEQGWQENTRVPKSPEPPPPLKRGGATSVSMRTASRASCASSSITTRHHPSPSFLPSLVCGSLSFRVRCQY